MLSAFIFLNPAGLTQSEQAEDSSCGKDYEEVFTEGDSNAVYINWCYVPGKNVVTGAFG